ncbi:50S ribosomal protein 6 [Marchantia polymorpha subsp. ruderalis]
MAALATQLSSLSLSPVQLTSSVRTETAAPRRVNLIECAKRPQKKCTAHHVKSRPKKHQPYDKNRQGPTVYPRLPKPPPIWGFDNGEPLAITEDDE